MYTPPRKRLDENVSQALQTSVNKIEKSMERMRSIEKQISDIKMKKQAQREEEYISPKATQIGRDIRQIEASIERMRNLD